MPPRLIVPRKDRNSPQFTEQMTAIERWANSPLLPYTPSTNITVGNGSLTGWFEIRGSWVHFNIQLTNGTTTAFPAATLNFGLPLAAAINVDACGTAFAQAGAGPTSVSGECVVSGSNPKLLVILDHSTRAFWSNLQPFNWVAATNNLIRINGAYMAADPA